MTASEIEKSGIYQASKFSVTLKNGSEIIFWSDLPNHKFFSFSSEFNTLQSYTYFDKQGRHDKIIIVKGEDISNIKILISSEEGERINNNWETFSTIILAIIILIGLYKACH